MAKADPARPNRCKYTGDQKQCHRDVVDGYDFCEIHSGSTASAKRANTHMYHLDQMKHREKLTRFVEHEEIKSLREEISITRMLIEERFNAIKCESDLLAAIGGLNTLLLTVERLVRSAHAIEQNLGSLLAKSSVLVMGRQIVEIIVEELQDVPGYEEIVDRISKRIVQNITEQRSEDS